MDVIQNLKKKKKKTKQTNKKTNQPTKQKMYISLESTPKKYISLLTFLLTRQLAAEEVGKPNFLIHGGYLRCIYRTSSGKCEAERNPRVVHVLLLSWWHWYVESAPLCVTAFVLVCSSAQAISEHWNGVEWLYSSTSMLAAYFMLTIITIDSILIVLHSSVFLV